MATPSQPEFWNKRYLHDDTPWDFGGIPSDLMFDHVYSEPHPLIDAQKTWLAEYEASFEGDAS